MQWVSLLLDDGLFVVTESKFVEEVLLSESLLCVEVSCAPLSLFVFLLVGDEQLLNLAVNHLLAPSLLLLRRLVVEQSSWLDAEVRAIVLELS